MNARILHESSNQTRSGCLDFAMNLKGANKTLLLEIVLVRKRVSFARDLGKINQEHHEGFEIRGSN